MTKDKARKEWIRRVAMLNTLSATKIVHKNKSYGMMNLIKYSTIKQLIVRSISLQLRKGFLKVYFK